MRPTSTENDSIAQTSTGRLRTRDRLASLKLENTQLKSKLSACEEKLRDVELESQASKSKLEIIEKYTAEIKRYKFVSYAVSCLTTIAFFTFLALFVVESKSSIESNCENGSPDINLPLPHFEDPRIISRQQWANRELKRNISDLIQLELPVEKGLVAHHTSVAENRCFTYGLS